VEKLGKVEIVRNKLEFLFLGGLVIMGLMGTLVFLRILIWGMPQMSPYPANPFFLFTACAFATYLGVARFHRFKRLIGLTNWDIVWINAAGLSTLIWYSFIKIEPGTIFSFIYTFLAILSIVCWSGYLFVEESLRAWLKTFAIYLLLSAIFYYIFCPFWTPA